MGKKKTDATILLLEDDKALKQIIEDHLEVDGFSVYATDNVNSAIKYAKEGNEINAVWLDHYLAGKKSGYEFVKEFRKIKKCEKIPVVVVSNSTSQNTVMKYLNLGVNDHIGKADHSLREIVKYISDTIG